MSPDVEAGGPEIMFPPFSCLCELCDCGRHKHHRNCRKTGAGERRRVATLRCPLSHYQSTFTCPQDIRPRSSKRPLLTPPHPDPPAMSFETTQRAEFTHRELRLRPRPRPIVQRIYAGSRWGRFVCESTYRQEFPAKEAQLVKPRRPVTNTRLSLAPFNSLTTNQQAFQLWEPQARVTYRELPPVAGSLLFPDQNQTFQTTSQEQFTGKPGSRPEPAKAALCSLKLEGEQELTTTHRAMFQAYPSQTRQCLAVPTRTALGLDRSAPMVTTSKYRSDFPSYPPQPVRSRLIPPAPDNLGLNHSLHSDYHTVQKEAYPGWDITQHRPAQPSKPSQELLEPRGGEFQGDTVTMLAYKPPPASRPRQQPLKRPGTVLRIFSGKFDGTTANKVSFQDWGVRARVRHGDLHHGELVRPLGKVQSQTTTGEAFVPKRAELVLSCKPEPQLELPQGQQDFTTITSQDYRAVPLPLCRLQLYLQQQRLRASSKAASTPHPTIATQ